MMSQNIDKVLSRGESIEMLIDKSEDLSSSCAPQQFGLCSFSSPHTSLVTSAFMFKKKSNSLRRTMWWKNAKMFVLLGVIGIVAIAILALIFYLVPLEFIVAVVTIVFAGRAFRTRIKQDKPVGSADYEIATDPTGAQTTYNNTSIATQLSFVDLRLSNTTTTTPTVATKVHPGVDFDGIATRIQEVQELMRVNDSEQVLESALESIDEKSKNQRKRTKKANTSYYRLGFQFISGDEMNNATAVRQEFQVESFKVRK